MSAGAARTKAVVRSPSVPGSPLYSQAVVAGGLAFLSGMTGVVPATGKMAGPTVQAQLVQAVANCRAVLAEVGATLADVVEVQALLARPEDFGAFNDAYAKLFPIEPPARSVGRLGPDVAGLLVSVRMVAAVPSSARGDAPWD